MLAKRNTFLQEQRPAFILLGMELKDRLKTARHYAKLSQVELAIAAGITQASISDLERGKSLATSHCVQIAVACNVSPTWLSDGSGEMTAHHHGPDENGSPSKKDYALIPQYTARASAGKGYHNDHIELSEGQGLVFKRDWLKRLSLKEESSCVIYAEGSSMEPTISDGDVLLIDRASTEPRSGKVYAIQRPDGSISVKRLVQPFAGGWVVRSDNPDKTLYPDEPISADDLQQIEIIGRSVWGGGGM
jgi:phage repressor protein C with HTH and peptisase S24 domain